MRFRFCWWVGLAAVCAACSTAEPPLTPTLSSTVVVATPVPTLPLPEPTRTLRPIDVTPFPTALPTDVPVVPTLETASPAPSAAPALAGIQVEVAAGRSGLRLRAYPDTRAEMQTSLAEYTQLTILGRTSDNLWLRVATPTGETGWIMVYFLNVAIDLDQLNIPVDVIVPENPPTLSPPTPAPGQPSQYVLGVTPNVREIFIRGQQLGNRADVFSKVGDSITVGTYFLYPVGWGSYNLREYAYLSATVQHFSAAAARDGNSFANHSLAADNGWTSSDILDPARAHPQLCSAGETPLECEYRIVRPAFALIMIGTNDVAELPVETFTANLNRMIELSLARGIVPAVSTIPLRGGFPVDAFNQSIRSAAARHNIPLWDYGAAMAVLPNAGLSTDGVHPSWPPGDFSAAADFSRGNLRFGYTMRNLLALQTLDTIWRAAAGG